MLTWKDGLDSSTFTNISSSASKLDFTVQIAQGGEGAQAMVSFASGSGSLTSITFGSKAVNYTTSTVKGITYAVFDAQPGAYEVLYGTQPGQSAVATNLAITQPSGSTSVPASNAVTASISNKSPFAPEATTPGQGGTGTPQTKSGGFPILKVVGYTLAAVATVGSVAAVIRIRVRHIPGAG